MKYLILFLLSFNAHAGLVECGGIEDGPAIQSSLDLGGRTELKGVCATTSQIIIRQPDGLGNQQGDTVLDGGVIRGPGIMIDGAATSHAVSMYVNGAASTVVAWGN
ncbi:MAG: hypothetical protein H5T98_09605 [Syntrophomonadaceae bacterium]|nr:hypothetical protein [Syntrophomonadaceae bacterium]